MDSNFIAELRHICQLKRCPKFYSCHQLFKAGAETNMPRVSKCKNPDVQSLLYAYNQDNAENYVEQEKTQDELWAQVQEEIFKAAMTPNEDTEIYTEVTDPQ